MTDMQPLPPVIEQNPPVTRQARSPLHDALERVGDRWSLAVVRALLDGSRRFSELERAVEGVSPTMLSRRLGQLEADGIVVARPYSSRPVRHRYELTDLGLGLAPVIDLLVQWGARSATGGAPAPASGADQRGPGDELPDELFYA